MRSLLGAFAAMTVIVTGTAVCPLPANAQGAFSFWSDPPPPRARTQERYYRRAEAPRPRPRISAASVSETPKAGREASLAPPVTAPVQPGSALVAIVSIRNQSITVWDGANAVLHSRVSTGQPGHDTPTGLFSVIQKNRYHESNIYSGAPMPWMHRITWSGIALHAGVVPNHPASHGCIRLPYDVAPKLWAISRMGMRVVVAPSELRPVAIDSALLPQPQLLSVAEMSNLLETVSGPGVAARLMSAGGSSDRLYNPLEVGALLRKQAAATVETSKIAAREALAASAVASAEANAAIADARAARAAVDLAEAEARSSAQTADADAKDQVDRAAAKIAADARLADAQSRLAAATRAEAEKDPRAFELARAARVAETLAEDAPDLLKAANRRQEAISVFISRQEGRVFVRQGFEPLLDASIGIDDALEPLGTHLFTATAIDGDGRTVKWSALTVVEPAGGTSASEALRRITMPPHVAQEIGRRLWTGASIIISDNGISNETGKGTDFVILTK